MYQRTLPLYRGQVDYKEGIPHIIAGAGGSWEGLSKFHRSEGIKWLASAYNTTTGFGILEANMTHLVWQYFSTQTGYPLIDELVVTSKR